MKKLLFAILLFSVFSANAQEKYIGLTRDSIKVFHAKYFETVSSNDTAIVVKSRLDGTNWRYFKFGPDGKCVLSAWEVPYYNDFISLEKKLKSTKYKPGGEGEYDFGVSKSKGARYSNVKETYMLMYAAINPKMTATTRAVVYFKGK